MRILLLLALLLVALAACSQGPDGPVTPPIVAVAETVQAATAVPTPPATTMALIVPATALSREAATEEATATPEPTFTPEPTLTPSPTPIPVNPVTSIELQLVASGYIQPLYVTHAGDDRLFVVEQIGRITVIEEGQRLAQPFLDIQDRVNPDAYERGLLGLAFHPHDQNGRFFVNYTREDGSTVVSRFEVSADANVADPGSEQVLLTVAQPYPNHNAGQISFGPDGNLYIGLGDGGDADDPLGHGQNASTLLGSLLRINIDVGEPYGIPGSNPFIGQDAIPNEIWATGLRNPWRFSFDRLTGDLFIADVGQNLWEEVSFQPASSSGGENYGWNRLEGTHCFQPQNCDPSGTVLPITEYDHSEGCSITGGYVYRGREYLDLYGNYFLADFCTGTIWSLFPDPSGEWIRTPVYSTGFLVSSFGEDVNGELYVVNHLGELYQIRSR